MDKCTTPVEKLGGQVPVSIVRPIFPHTPLGFSTELSTGLSTADQLVELASPQVIHKREVAPISASTESLKNMSDRFGDLGRGWGVGWEEQEAVRRWREAVGESLAKLARPLYVERGVLYIAVASPVSSGITALVQRTSCAPFRYCSPKQSAGVALCDRP